jgi:hypothetical protein
LGEGMERERCADHDQRKKPNSAGFHRKTPLSNVRRARVVLVIRPVLRSRLMSTIEILGQLRA